MPLPSRSEVESLQDCVSKSIRAMYHHGENKKRSASQIKAIAYSHCRKLLGGEKKKMEIKEKLEEIKAIFDQYFKNEKKKKWIQKAVSPQTKGDFGEWCKRHGFSGVCQECINLAARTGGRASKMALFAVNVSKGKYHWPKKGKK